MVGIVRKRSRSPSKIGSGFAGSKFTFGTWSIGVAVVPDEYMEDVVGNPTGQNPLLISKFDQTPIVIDGTASSGAIFKGYPATWSQTKHSHLTPVGSFRDATQAIAASHPGQSGVSIPNFLYELKDLPHMVSFAIMRAQRLYRLWHNRGWKISHRNLSYFYNKKSAGEDWLDYQFGWLPLVSDIASILDLGKYLDHRKKMYSSIRGNTLVTGGSLGSLSAFSKSRTQVQGSGAAIDAIISYTTTKESWWSARWKVDPIRFGKPLTSDVQSKFLDFLGIGNDIPIQLWNALPWTWLIDWCVNVQPIIGLMGNRQGCQFDRACIMRKTITKIECHPIFVPAGLTATSGGQDLTLKERLLFSPSFFRSDAGFNIFQPSHLATLASLKVTKFAGSSRF